jgi:NADPH-dependent 2,4-dienoyl-CoA reductase/sulfur reductase-like enzyme
MTEGMTGGMTERTQLAVVGAGPAGLAAAAAAASSGIEVVIIDEQPAAGGQIYRGIERADAARRDILGPDYARGAALLGVLDQPSVTHLTGTTVWQISPEREIHLTRNGTAGTLVADRIILATGAMERPMPFPGWTLPGVMTAGAGQILLKGSGLVPQGEVVLAGSGPLLLLLAAQYLRAGGKISAIVETTPRGNAFKALRHLPGALRANGYLLKGVALLREIKRRGVPHYRGASGLEALGDDRVAGLRFASRGRSHELPCSLLLLHQGIVPNVQITRSLNLRHDWDQNQRCWRPYGDAWGRTRLEGIAVAGDGAGIAGADAAEHAGRLAGLHAAWELGALTVKDLKTRSRPERRALAYHLAVRPFLDALYAPAPAFLSPADRTVVCRCEEVTAGAIRGFVGLGCLGPNQTKSFGRPGMGPCQGRFCGLTVSEIIAQARGVPPEEVGYYRIRPPIKPVTLGELAAMAEGDENDDRRQGVV